MDDFTNVEMDATRIEQAIRELLVGLGENPDREGLRETPSRVARACSEMLAGMRENPAAHLRRQFREELHGETVTVRDISFTSLCEHHLLPFTGKVHIAYIPQAGRITGLSKLARCVEGYARRLQVQERLTAQVADAIMQELDPLGAIVVIEAEHSCMTARGVRKPSSLTITSAMRGILREDPQARAEALSLLGLPTA